MRIRGGRGFIGEVLGRPIPRSMAVFVGLISVSAAIGVGESWTVGIKGLVVVGSLLLIYVLHVAYFLYKKMDRPLRVRKVQRGTHYFKNNVTIILERSDAVHVGDILTLYLCEEEVETPICLLSVESTTSRNFPQSVVFKSINDDLLGYLIDESRLKQLQAKRGVTKGYLEWLITQ